MTTPPWLPEYVQARMAEAIRKDPTVAKELDEAGGICLFYQIGSDVYLRPDGSVWFREYDQDSPEEDCNWREAQGNARWGALVVGSKRMPELKALLPVRQPTTPDCSTCKGSGKLSINIPSYEGSHGGMLCPHRGGLGWVYSGAA